SYTNNVNAGTATAGASFAGDANHTASNDSKNFTIGKADPTARAEERRGRKAYGGAAQTPCSAAETGAGGLDQSLTASNANVGKASSTTVVSCSAGPFTYGGAAQTPCSATVTGTGGLNQSLTVSYTNNANAGTATASASFAGDANHTGSSDSKNFTIGKADPTVTATGNTCTYNGSPCAGKRSSAGANDEPTT